MVRRVGDRNTQGFLSDEPGKDRLNITSIRITRGEAENSMGVCAELQKHGCAGCEVCTFAVCCHIHNSTVRRTVGEQKRISDRAGHGKHQVYITGIILLGVTVLRTDTKIVIRMGKFIHTAQSGNSQLRRGVEVNSVIAVAKIGEHFSVEYGIADVVILTNF